MPPCATLPRVMAFCCLVSLSACTGGRVYDDPIAVMNSPAQDSETRLKAAQQAEERFPDDDRRLVALNKMVWDRGYGSAERRYAVDQLIKYDEADFKRKLARRIVLIHNPETVEYILGQAVERGWTDMTPTIVRQYATRSPVIPDTERIERAAIEKLNPGVPVERVIFDVFAGSDETVEQVQRVAAWELLCRLTPRGQLLGYLNDAPAGTAMVADLKACAADLATLPTNQEGVLWLSHLRGPARQSWWAAAKERVAMLNDTQRQGLELRHVAVLVEAPPRLLAADRSTLLRDLRLSLDGREHHVLAPTYDGQAKDYPQRLSEVVDRLVWGDAMVMTYLVKAMENSAVQVALFAQAEQDKNDAATEHGGAMVFDNQGSLVAKPFPARFRAHDLKFISPPDLIEAVYTGAAHYHFHAQEYRNREHAGPGRGDLEFATRLGFNCLVFTFITKDKLNADYYQPGGIVVDLGVISR